MLKNPDTCSRLIKMRICNIGCIGEKGVEVALDDIVCLVGANNSGKSTVLRAYEAAVTPKGKLAIAEIHTASNGKPATVELWVHIPDGAENVDAKWKENKGDLRLVRSLWTWDVKKVKDGKIESERKTWNPQTSEYSDDDKASGLDTVFNSRLPQPFRIGSLEDPSAEHKKLLELVLEPIKTKFADLMKDDNSDLRIKMKALKSAAEQPVAEFRADLDDVQRKVDKSFKRVFSDAKVQLTVNLGEFAIDPGAALVKSSRIDVVESHGPTAWDRQGTGSQRALFWSMLEVRSELKRIDDNRKQMEKNAKKKEEQLKKPLGKRQSLIRQADIAKCDKEIQTPKEENDPPCSNGPLPSMTARPTFLPGYMLLIDEPETALHPSAIRAAKDHLYSLAAEAGWQVMLSTHHPAFVDPLKDHTTIVRLNRPDVDAAPNVYRADHMTFQDDDKANLKSLLAFDQSVAEMFFASKVIIVEGDTEFAAFTVAMDNDPQTFPVEKRPLILRARGKWTIPVLLRMLKHFKLNCAVLHDVDSPKSSGGARSNNAYTANHAITKAVKDSRMKGVPVIHRCSVPDFERQHGMDLPSKDKPFAAWKEVGENTKVLASVRAILDELCVTPDDDADRHPNDGQHYEEKCKAWATANAPNDAAFTFDGPAIPCDNQC